MALPIAPSRARYTGGSVSVAIKEPAQPATHNPFAEAVAQFDLAAERLNLDPGLRKILRSPKREITVHFPVRMDDGTVEVYTGYRVQHNVNRGPAKGGIRYDTNVRWTRCARWRCG